jgi:hypothetical protein
MAVRALVRRLDSPAAGMLHEVELSQRPSLPELTAATLRVLASEPQRAAA